MNQRSRSFKRVFGTNLTNLPSNLSSSTSSLKRPKPRPPMREPSHPSVHDYLKSKDLPKKDDELFIEGIVTRPMRRILVQWLVSVQNRFKLAQETLFEGVCYMDKILSNKMNFKLQELQLIGITCLWMAAKYEEVYSPPLKHFVEVTDDAYNKKDILRMEELIIKTLEFNLTFPTRHHFVLNQLQQLQVPPKSMLHEMSLYLCELSVLDIWGCREQDIAEGAIYLASRILRSARLGVKEISVGSEAKSISYKLVKLLGSNAVSQKYDCEQRQYVGGYGVQRREVSP